MKGSGSSSFASWARVQQGSLEMAVPEEVEEVFKLFDQDGYYMVWYILYIYEYMNIYIYPIYMIYILYICLLYTFYIFTYMCIIYMLCVGWQRH